MESKNTFSLLVPIDDKPEEDMPTDSLAHDITNEARELFFQNFFTPAAFISFLFNFSEKVAIMSFVPAVAFLEKSLEALPDGSTTTAEEVVQDNMKITADTNQQSSRIILEDTPTPIPD
ncbi:hypothetical protein RCL_jg283.t1 [Rhizophagus clarus]|uniref:Uncharacterized protein n=1 Tax=Rhizophagus clarus TaxID=94130 RepID=A0A8H3LVW0_9GLOM|nr:hypothetical protein RCL_jg283.t1 [Rhizophagus clarus]